MDEKINTIDLSNDYTEKFLASYDQISTSKVFNIEIISKRMSSYKTVINFDFTKRNVDLTTDEDIEIKIKFDDILAFIPENKLYYNTAFDIRSEISKKYKFPDNLKNKTIAHLNFFPKFAIKKCSCCHLICCQCKELNIEILIPENHFAEIDQIFKKILFADNLYPNLINIINKRKILLFLNPISGKGLALRIWNTNSDIEIEIFRTKYALHAYEHTSTLNFMQYQGVICCSGDGILHEVVNAIFHRKDKEDFMQSCPVGIIPGGTSNGLAKSICASSGEICNPQNCAFIISKGNVKNIDIMEIESAKREKPIYSFLSITWGIIADIDLESENCRCLGPLRFTMYGVLRWTCLRNSYGAFYYLEENSNMNINDIPSIKSSEGDYKDESRLLPSENLQSLPQNKYNFVRENCQFYYFVAMNTPWLGETLNTAPMAKLDDGFIDLIKMNKSKGKFNLLKQLFNQDSGNYFNSEGKLNPSLGLEYIKTKCWRLIPKLNLQQSDDVLEDRKFPRFYSIDGERYAIEPIQVKSLKRSLRIFCLN